MTSISANCRHRVIGRATVPGLTVQLEESWLEQPDEPIVTVCYSEYVLYLLKRHFRAARSWARFQVGQCANRYVQKQDLAFSPPNIPQQVYTSNIPAGTRAVACYFDPDFFRARSGLNDDWTIDRLNACHTVHGPMMMQAMGQLFDEIATPGFASDILIDSIGQLLVVQIARYFNSKTLVKEYAGKRLQQRHLNSIYEFVEGSDGHLTAEEIARACNLSSDYLRRAFKNTTGKSLRLYVEQIRLTRAKALLAEQRMVLKQVAHHAGFTNVRSFCFAFKRATGETPTEYQSRIAPARGKAIRFRSNQAP